VSRVVTVRAVLALVALGWLLAIRPARLGLDLRGGTQDGLETRHGELARAGTRRITVEPPAPDEPRR
jgi:SecD/SecF fusion protein